MTPTKITHYGAQALIDGSLLRWNPVLVIERLPGNVLRLTAREDKPDAPAVCEIFCGVVEEGASLTVGGVTRAFEIGLKVD